MRTGTRLPVIALAMVTLVAGCSSASTGRGRAASSPPASQSVTRPARSTPSPIPSTSAPSGPAAASSSTRPAAGTPSSTPSARADDAESLPLPFPTGSARQVITVVAGSKHDTTATLQAWRRVDGGWRRHGAPVAAWLGTDGLSRHPSESRSATPIGSFTLTQAFGHDADPGTRLPYLHTSPDDWWISQAGPLYNTVQDCAADCAFTRGDPNEHLYDETPFYDYAAVIDYNTRNAPGGVRPGAGSAFFLHVTVHEPTQGCISIDQASLVSILRWLDPRKHPRIVIGVG